jgi:hypothetical protein
MEGIGASCLGIIHGGQKHFLSKASNTSSEMWNAVSHLCDEQML